MSKYDKLFKINVGHNVSEAFDFHDVCKTLLMRLLRRKYKNCEIYSEYHPLRPNEVYPDVYLKLKNQVIIFELQCFITKEWEQRIVAQYPNEDVLILPLQLIRKKWEERKTIYPESDMLELLTQIIEEYL